MSASCTPRNLLRATIPLGGDLAKLDLDAIMRKPWFVPETTPVQDQLDGFLKERNHFALVVDEYGELQGLITLEDILEEIVGHIHDEHDVAVQGVRPQPDGSVNVDGWVPIRDVNRAMNWNLPDEEAVTVAGLVIHEAQTIPETGQSSCSMATASSAAAPAQPGDGPEYLRDRDRLKRSPPAGCAGRRRPGSHLPQASGPACP
ncbi:MAG: transporter associated domain-containing protein [Hyphomonas sp.]